MTKRINNHNKWIALHLEKEKVTIEELNYHEKQICFLQHERLIHLLVTFFTSALLIGSLVLSAIIINWLILLLNLILCTLTLAYFFHYYFLENTVQKWYEYYSQHADPHRK